MAIENGEHRARALSAELCKTKNKLASCDGKEEP